MAGTRPRSPDSDPDGAPEAPSGGSSEPSKLLAVVSALLLGAGGLVVGGILLAIAGGVAVVLVGELSLGVSLGLGLLMSQIGIALVAIGYVAARPSLSGLLDGVAGHEPSGERFSIGVSTPDARDLLTVILGWIGAIAGVFLFSIVVTLVIQVFVQEDPGANPAAEAGLEQPEVLLLLIPAMLLIVGPAEELLFRGVVQGRLREAFDRWAAIGIASVIFAFLHFFVLTGGQPTANAVAVSVLLVPAVVLGAAYEYTDNIVVPALIHGLYNSTWLLMIYALVVYTDALEGGAAAVLLGL